MYECLNNHKTKCPPKNCMRLSIKTSYTKFLLDLTHDEEWKNKKTFVRWGNNVRISTNVRIPTVQIL